MILLKTVRIKRIRAEVVPIINAIDTYERGNEEVVITGWQDPSYRPNGAHADGRAIDLRIWNLADPNKLADHLKAKLYPLSKHYIILWGDDGHRDHIHVGYHLEERK